METKLSSVVVTQDHINSPNLSENLEDFVVKFWGVRGSVPTPGKDTVRYGGNTSCIEMQIAGKRLIFDGGTGMRELG
ncbi:beta-lactamase, partial [Hydrocoleum sp. CS-953]